MTQAKFRDLTERVFAAEKKGSWSDWTADQQAMITAGDWQGFSISRGYTDDEIIECGIWQDIVADKTKNDPGYLLCVSDLLNKKVLQKLSEDKNNEIIKSSIGPASIRGLMMDIEEKINDNPLHMTANDLPLKHEFIDGLYIRESFVQAGVLFTTRIHKVDHVMILMEGAAEIMTDTGFKRIEAPFRTITKRGTKRVVITETDTVCITVHPTSCTTVEDVEKELYADSFEQVGLDCVSNHQKIGVLA